MLSARATAHGAPMAQGATVQCEPTPMLWPLPYFSHVLSPNPNPPLSFPLPVIPLSVPLPSSFSILPLTLTLLCFPLLHPYPFPLQAVHQKCLDANLLAEFVSCPVLLLP